MAKQPMLKFVQIERDMPVKRDANVRNSDFDEIYAEFARAKAEEQSSRCSQCGVPFCQSALPPRTTTSPTGFKLDRRPVGLDEAYEISAGHQQFPGNLRPHLPPGPACARAIA